MHERVGFKQDAVLEHWFYALDPLGTASGKGRWRALGLYAQPLPSFGISFSNVYRLRESMVSMITAKKRVITIARRNG